MRLTEHERERLQSDCAERSAVPAPAQEQWAVLDAEFEARTPSEATRAASRQLGGGLLRLLRSVLPGADLVTPWARCATSAARPGAPSSLPADGAPALDLPADYHLTAEVRLFAS